MDTFDKRAVIKMFIKGMSTKEIYDNKLATLWDTSPSSYIVL